MFTPVFQEWILELWSQKHRPKDNWSVLAWTVAMVLYNSNKTEFFRMIDDVTYSQSSLHLLDDLGWWLQDKDRLHYTLLHNPAKDDLLVLNLASGYGLVLDMFYQAGYRRFLAVEIKSEIAAAVRQFFVEANYPGIQVEVVNRDGIEFVEKGSPIAEDFLLEATAFNYATQDARDYVAKHMGTIREKFGPHLRHICVNGYLDSDIDILVARKKRTFLWRLDRKVRRFLPGD